MADNETKTGEGTPGEYSKELTPAPVEPPPVAPVRLNFPKKKILPTKKTPPMSDLQNFLVLIYGPTKIGKTSWASHTDHALFLATEPGLNALAAYQVPINSWDELLQAAGEIAGGGHEFKTIIIDTIDNAYKFCSDYICRKYKIEHESDLPYGKGFGAVNREFLRFLTKLALLPYGLFLISHSIEKEVDTRFGKGTKTVPTLPDKARKIVLGLVDIILYCDIEEDKDESGVSHWRRVVRTKPNIRYDAGDRTGRLPETLPLDYAAFVSAFVEATEKGGKK